MKLSKRLLSLALVAALFMITCVPASAASNPYRIEVDCYNNIVTVYSTLDNSIVRQMVCSSGVQKWPSPHGTFTLPDKGRSGERKEWYAFEDGYGKYGTRIRGNYLFHSYLFRQMDDSKVDWEAYTAMGCDASHGCIRLWVEDAKWITENCFGGTKVRVYDAEKRYDYLKELLYEKTFTIDDGITYEEFTCQAQSAGELGYNSKGEEVTKLQNRLKALGLFTYEADGFYGPAMVRTAKAIQGALGRKVTGVFDEELLDIIYSDDAPTSTIVTLREGDESGAVASMQAALARLGLYDGEIDGVFDEEVTQAVKTFQTLAKTEATGIVSSELRVSMDNALVKLNAKFGENSFAIDYVDTEVIRAYVKSDSKLNMHKKKSQKSDTIARIPSKAEVELIEKGKQWSYVSYDGKKGYVSTKYLRFETETVKTPTYVAADAQHAPVYTDAEFTANVIATQEITFGKGNTNERMNVRQSPSQDAKIVFLLPPETTVRILSVNGSWAYISYGGRTGFAKKSMFDIKTAVEIAPYMLTTTQTETEDTSTYALVINEDGADIVSATDSSETLMTVGYLDRVQLSVEGTNRSMVRSGDLSGYIANEDIFIGTSAECDARAEEIIAESTYSAIVTSPSDAGLNMRASASTDADVLTVLLNGEIVTVVDEIGEWAKVKYNTLEGWVMSAYIERLEDGEAYDPDAAGFVEEEEEDEEDPFDTIDDEPATELIGGDDDWMGDLPDDDPGFEDDGEPDEDLDDVFDD